MKYLFLEVLQMDRTIDIIEYLPDYFKNVKEYKNICTTENEEITNIQTEIKYIQNEQFISTCSEYAVKRWEKILEITPADDETLIQRKFRILLRLNYQLPYTEDTLRKQLIELCGEKGYLLSVDPVNCTIEVRITLGVKYMFDEVEKLLKRVLPVNLMLDYRLLFNRHTDLKKYTHAQLKTLTHKVIKEEVLSI